MDTLYGHGWSNKQTLAKSGEREEVEKVLEGDWWSQFGQQSAEEFWRFAGTRAEDGNGGPKGEPFFFGSDWVSEDDLILNFFIQLFFTDFKPSRIGSASTHTILDDYQPGRSDLVPRMSPFPLFIPLIFSQFCALLFPDNIPTLRERRPRKNQRDHDWAGVLVELAGCTILDAIQVRK